MARVTDRFPPPPRLPTRTAPARLPVDLPAEEMTPKSVSVPGMSAETDSSRDGVVIGTGKGRVKIGTAVIVGVVAAVTAAYGGHATAGANVDPEDFREFKREVREDLRAIRLDVRAIRNERRTSQSD